MGLDMDLLKSRATKSITFDEALSDSEPMDWPQDVIEGKRKAVATSIKCEDNKPCAKLEVHIMAPNETSNLIEILRGIGWNGDQIADFLLGIEDRVTIQESIDRIKEESKE